MALYIVYCKMWGISPASNLLGDSILVEEEGSKSTDTINILLLCPSDPRSIIKTIAKASVKASRQKMPMLNFFVFEEVHEVLARHFLLLSILLDQAVPMRQRAVIFLEVFGNLMIQDKTALHIEEKGKCLAQMVLVGCDERVLGGEIFNLSLLKQRDLDELGSIFEFWTTSGEHNLKDKRDRILRSFYGARYDRSDLYPCFHPSMSIIAPFVLNISNLSLLHACFVLNITLWLNRREGVTDWDYHSHIKPYASIIHPRQFREWRLHGQAFEFGDALYTSENVTLIGPNCRNNSKQKEKIDIVTGPFLSYGIDCDRKNSFADCLFDVANKGTGAEQHRHSAAEVSVYNILSFMWEIENGKHYEMTVKGDIHSGLGNDSVSEKEIESSSSADQSDLQYYIIPVSDFSKISKKKFENFFDSVFISECTTSILENDEFYNLLKDGAMLTVETSRFNVAKDEENKKDSIDKIRNILSKMSVIEVVDSMNSADALLKFVLKAK